MNTNVDFTSMYCTIPLYVLIIEIVAFINLIIIVMITYDSFLHDRS